MFGVSGSPHGLTVGPDNNLWFTEDNAKLGRITTSGAVTRSRSRWILRATTTAHHRADGNLWLIEPAANKIDGYLSAAA